MHTQSALSKTSREFFVARKDQLAGVVDRTALGSCICPKRTQYVDEQWAARSRTSADLVVVDQICVFFKRCIREGGRSSAACAASAAAAAAAAAASSAFTLPIVSSAAPLRRHRGLRGPLTSPLALQRLLDHLHLPRRALEDSSCPSGGRDV
jgi:hypothetical protein